MPKINTANSAVLKRRSSAIHMAIDNLKLFARACKKLASAVLGLVCKTKVMTFSPEHTDL